MNVKKTLVSALMVSLALNVLAIPAKRGTYVVTQPDGTTLTVKQVGDENLHFLLTTDDKLLVCEEDGRYCYGRVDMNLGTVVSSGVKAYDPNVRPASQVYLAKDLSDVNIEALRSVREKLNVPQRVAAVRPSAQALAAPAVQRAIAQNGMGKFTTVFPAKGKIKALVILAEYSDVKFNANYPTNAHDYFTGLLTTQNFNQFNATGCARQYFEEQSGGQFMPQFDVIGPVTLPNAQSYYGGNDSYGNDKNAAMMIAHACMAIENMVNFADYDNDGDGLVDNVFVFYAGGGEASGGGANTVWPHSYDIRSDGLNFTRNGVKVGRYACTNEWGSGRPDGVGTFIHEFSHVMGLPDLYDTQYGYGGYTPNEYSALDYGPYNNNGCTPPNYSIYERNAMGWMEPRLITGATTVSLDNITSNDGCIFLTEKETEFYLVENRQLKGWDKYIPNHGMLIWHIDFVQSIFDRNVVNNNSNHHYVQLLAANNNRSNYAGYPWPGTSGNTSFTSTTTPAFTSWAGKAINLPITNITEEDGIITFDVAGGKRLATPEPETVTDKGSDYFVVSWKPVTGASDYFLTVEAVSDGGQQGSEVADMGSGSTAVFPDGWTSTVTATYTSTSNFGSTKPSLKFSKTGETVTTREFPSAITSISMWHKGMNTKTSGSKLTVSGYVPTTGEWKEIAAIIPTSEKAIADEVIEDIPRDVRQIRFVYEKVSGNMAVDDITITYGGASSEVVPGYNRMATAGATSVRVSIPSTINTSHFRYYVQATDGSSVSSKSEAIDVIIPSSGVDNIVDETSGFGVAVVDRTVTVSGTCASHVAVYDTTGRLVLSAPVSYGTATFTLPSSGLYIVKADSKTAKVLAH